MRRHFDFDTIVMESAYQALNKFKYPENEEGAVHKQMFYNHLLNILFNKTYPLSDSKGNECVGTYIVAMHEVNDNMHYVDPEAKNGHISPNPPKSTSIEDTLSIHLSKMVEMWYNFGELTLDRDLLIIRGYLYEKVIGGFIGTEILSNSALEIIIKGVTELNNDLPTPVIILFHINESSETVSYINLELSHDGLRVTKDSPLYENPRLKTILSYLELTPLIPTYLPCLQILNYHTTSETPYVTYKNMYGDIVF
jgi:hypothetical protein